MLGDILLHQDWIKPRIPNVKQCPVNIGTRAFRLCVSNVMNSIAHCEIYINFTYLILIKNWYLQYLKAVDE